ncbi:MAG TPA: hypothetical protein VIV27_04060, partial [Halioglobus sp.]
LAAAVYIAVHQNFVLPQTGDMARHACPSIGKLSTMTFERGSRIVFSGSLVVVAKQGTDVTWRKRFESIYGDTIELRAGPLDLQLMSPRGVAPKVCRIEAGQVASAFHAGLFQQ